MKFFRFEIKMPLKIHRLLFAFFLAWSSCLGLFIPSMYLIQVILTDMEFLHGYIRLEFEFLFSLALMSGFMALIFIHLFEINE